MESVVVGTDQNRADAIGTTGDQHPVQGAFADRIGENVSGNIGMRCSRMAQHKLRFLRRYRTVWSNYALVLRTCERPTAWLAVWQGVSGPR